MMSKLKEYLKKSEGVVTLYKKMQKIQFDAVSALSVISPKLVSEIRYKNSFGRKPDLKNPKYFNEKLMWLKLNRYANDPLVVQGADKYAVRKYVEDCGLSNILIDLIGVWDKAEDIDWEKLPNKFAIKCNHGCGYNIICKNKDTFDTQKAEVQLNKWLKENHWKEYAEVHYKHIPKKIICEKYIEGKNEALPVDYKIYCFHGKPMYIGNFIERNMETKSIIRGYFDLDWNPSSVFRFKDEMEVEKFPKPDCLDEMLSYAEILSKPFPFVRVDFYELDGQVYFGELTFTPTGCLGTYYSDEAYSYLGDALNVHQ